MEPKQNQHDLLKSYREVIEGANSIILRWDRQGTILFMNPFGLRFFGFTEEELFGKNVMETIVSPSSLEGKDLDAMIKEILESPDRFAKNENENICRDGTRVWINWTNKPIRDDSGEYVQVLSIGNDVTERRLMQKKLAESEARYRAIFEDPPIAIWEMDFTDVKRSFDQLRETGVSDFSSYFAQYPDKAVMLAGQVKIVNVNRTSVLIFGGKSKEDLLANLPGYFTDESFMVFRKKMISLAEGRTQFECLIPLLDLSGRQKVLHLNLRVLPGHEETLSRVLVSFVDITGRKHAEEALRESESRYRSLVESTSDWVWATDDNGFYSYASPKVKDLLGYEPWEVIGKTPFDLMPRDEAKRLANVFRNVMSLQKPFSRFEKIYLHKDGKYVTLESSGVPVLDEKGKFEGYRGIDRDITERKKMEHLLREYRAHLEELVEQRTKELAAVNEQLQQSQKMEAVGLLAGGVAHDFSNILTAIKGSVYLVQKHLEPGSPLMKYVEQVISSIGKANNLSQSLLAFSRKQTIALQPVDFNEIIHKAAKMLVPLIGEHIELSLTLNDGNLAVMADRNQIEQILMNLATNARDAMPDGGKLTIRTDRVQIDEGFQKEHGFGSFGNYVLLSVSDTGEGMEEETRGRIYEPFFTTKALGKGSGLGLAVTYGIVKQHNGYIDVETAPGKGTTFRIYLPALKAKAAQTESRHIPPAAGGGETILFAEDDRDARETMSEVLRLSGYTVLEAEDGEAAVRIFTDKRDQIDLVFLDVRMPKKNGREVYEEIKQVSPESAVLFVSGYTKDIIDSQGISEEKLNFISKAASPEEILGKIREMLGN